MTSLLKFLAGALLLQACTALVVIAALESPEGHGRWLFVALAAVLAVAAALWFAAVAAGGRAQALARIRERHTRERAALQVDAARERTRLIQESQRQAARERRRVESRAGLKVGAAFAGVMGLGLVLLFSQLVSFGLLTLSAGGGTAAGYFLRLRQERRGRAGALPGRDPAAGGEPPPSPAAALEGPRRAEGQAAPRPGGAPGDGSRS